MKTNRIVLGLAVFILFFSSCKKDVIEEQSQSQLSASDAMSSNHKLIVVVKDGFKMDDVTKAMTSVQGRSLITKEILSQMGIMIVNSSDATLADRLRKLPGVEAVASDVKMKLLPSVPFERLNKTKNTSKSIVAKNPFSYLQWALDAVHVKGAWNKDYEGKNAVVAVLDGGFYTHDPDIAPNVIAKQSFVEGEPVEFKGEGFSHGTHVAGIIAAADNDIGVIGVAPKAKLMLVKVLGDDGFGSWSSIIEGIYYAAMHGANVINMSLGGYLSKDENKELVTALNKATRFAHLLGVTVIAAAGNDAVNFDKVRGFSHYPAACQFVLSIAANGPKNWAYNPNTNLYKPAVYSNYGKNFVSLGAPGGNLIPPLDYSIVIVGNVIAPAYAFDMVLSNGFYDKTYGYGVGWAAGTSQAAPYASGIAALLYGKYKGIPFAPLVEYVLTETATVRAQAAYFGKGEVNGASALRYKFF